MNPRDHARSRHNSGSDNGVGVVPLKGLILLYGILTLFCWRCCVASSAGEPLGVTYTPNHNWDYPSLGGFPNVDGLRAAIDEDLRLLSHYFTRIRTLRANYYGIDIVPIARKHGLRVYLGVPTYITARQGQQQVAAVVRALTDYPETVAAIVVGDNDAQSGGITVGDLLARVSELKAQIGPQAAARVEFAVFDGIIPKFHANAEIRRLIESLDGVGFPVEGTGDLESEWRPIGEAIPRSKLVLVEAGFPTDCVRKFQATVSFSLSWFPPWSMTAPECNLRDAVGFYNRLIEWQPSDRDHDRVVKFWPAAFDVLVDDSSPESLALRRRSGFFTATRRRKELGFPAPLDPQRDPIGLPSGPRDPNCELGMYLTALLRHEDDVGLCLLSGYNFRNPTPLDEATIKPVCANAWCRHLVARLRVLIPNPPPCPFSDEMTERDLREFILEPFDRFCPTDQSMPSDLTTIPNPAACNYLTDPLDKRYYRMSVIRRSSNSGNAKEQCEERSGFALDNMVPLTQAHLEIMCFEPSCELIMGQMAMPPPSPSGCSSRERGRRDWLESNVLVPYFDGCFHPSSTARDYYDTTRRVRRERPVLPATTPVPVLPAPPPSNDSTKHDESIGVTYTPNHNWAYPVFGGFPDVTKLRAAIDEDFRLLSRYFASIRTLRASYYGIDLAPIAYKYGVRLYLGTPTHASQRVARLQDEAVLRAIRDHPETVQAVVFDDSDNDVQSITSWPSDFVMRVQNIRQRAVGPPGQVLPIAAFDRNFPKLLAGTNTSGLDAIAETLNGIGFPLGPDLDWEWGAISTRRPRLLRDRLLLLETGLPTSCLRTFKCTKTACDSSLPPFAYTGPECNIESAMAFYERLGKWSPPDGANVVKFWPTAFDAQFDDDNAESLTFARRSGFFTMERARKALNFPRPLRSDDDPITLPTQTPDPNCPLGMYHYRLIRQTEDARVCLMSGFNFRSPTRFDERSIRAACDNYWCRRVVDVLRTMPSPPPCPYDAHMSEAMMRSWILEPFEQLCPGKPPLRNDIYGMPNPTACVDFSDPLGRKQVFTMEVIWNKEQDREQCELLSGFSPTSGKALTQAQLEKMCLEPSCELIMSQMARPQHSTSGCTIHESQRREWLEKNVLIPFFDGCYEESMIASDYFDTTYRIPRRYPKLPSNGTDAPPSLSLRPTLPLQPVLISDEPSAYPADQGSLTSDGDSASAEGSRPRSPGSSRRRRPRQRSGSEDTEEVEGNEDTTSSGSSSTMGSRLSVKTNGRRERRSSRSTESPQTQHPSVDSSTTGDPMAQPLEHMSEHGSRSRRIVMGVLAAMSATGLFGVFVVVVRRRQHVRDGDTDGDGTYQSVSDAALVGGNDMQIWGTHESKPLWADAQLAALYIPPQHIRDVSLIGSGGQALVYLVELTVPGPRQTDQLTQGQVNSNTTSSPASCRYLAAKRLTKSTRTNDAAAVANFIAEVKLVAALHHPNIVSLVGVTWSSGPDVQALFELLPGGDLAGYLRLNPPSPWSPDKLQVAMDVIDALAYVHTLEPQIVHRDIKSRNVLLLVAKDATATATTTSTATSGMSPSRHLRAKLTDFGVARQQSAHATMTTGVGTSRWLAPEVILGGGGYDASCDVYSFGVLLSELDTHALPFSERQTPTGDMLPDIALLQLIAMEGITPGFNLTSPPGIVALARECLAYEPTCRPTAAVVAQRLRELTSEAAM